MNSSENEKCFRVKLLRKSKNISLSVIFSPKSCRLRDNVEEYGKPEQATDDNIIRRVRFACWVTKAIDRRPDYLILIVFRGSSDFATAPPCYVNTHIASLIYMLYARAACYEELQVSYVTLVSIFLPDDCPCKAETCGAP